VTHCTGDGEIAFEHASKRGCEAKSVKKSRDTARARLKWIAAAANQQVWTKRAILGRTRGGLLKVDESTRFPSRRLVGFQQLGGDYAHAPWRSPLRRRIGAGLG
jgi:hypothetical protein